MKEKNQVQKVMPWIMLIMVTTSSLLNSFSIISPMLAKTFAISASAVSIQTVIITLSMGVAGIVYATFADYISIRKLLLIGLTIMVIGSVIGFIFSGNFIMVVVASSLETLGGQASNALLLIAAVKYLQNSEGSKYYGYYAACINGAQLLGILLGGVIATYIGWKFLFLFPLVSVLAYGPILKYMPEDSKLANKKLDIVGISLLTAFTFFISLYFSNKSLSSLGIALLLCILLCIYVQKKKDAFVDPKFFSNKRYTLAIVLGGLINSLLVAYPFMFSFMVTSLHGVKPDVVSMILLPSYVAAIIVATCASKISGKIGIFKSMVVSLSVIMVGLLLDAAFLEKSMVILAIGSCIFSAGLSLFSPQVQNLMFTSLPEDKIGVGSGIYGLVFSIAMSLGVAITGSLLGVQTLQKHAALAFVESRAALYSNILLIFAAIMVIGIFIIIINKKLIFGKEEQ